MSALIEGYRKEYGANKKSSGRERSILDRIRKELGQVRPRSGRPRRSTVVTGLAEAGLSDGTAVRHFSLMHHIMEKACTICSRETGIDRKPADLVEVRRPDDQRERYLSAEEIAKLRLVSTGSSTGPDRR